MSLVESIDALSQRAKALASLEEKKAESKRLRPLLEAADSLAQQLNIEIQQLGLLEAQGVKTKTIESAPDAIKTLEKLKLRFDREKRAQSLVQGKDWTLFKSKIETVCVESAKISKAEWISFVANSYTGQRPGELENTLAPTGDNKNLLRKYSDTYKELERLARVRPNERGDFDRIRNIASELKEIHMRFDFNVPEEVKTFLIAISEGGALLDLLTEDVLKWLEEKGTKESYRVVGARVG